MNNIKHKIENGFILMICNIITELPIAIIIGIILILKESIKIMLQKVWSPK